MYSYKILLRDVINGGERRETRSGVTISEFGKTLQFDLSKGFPAVTSKRLAWKAVVGELLWFLSGKTDLGSLRVYTFGEDKGQHTIWTDDYTRWSAANGSDGESLGKLYGHQWRKWGGSVDQISNLIHNIKNSPTSRYHVVMAWDASVVDSGSAALPPCHMGFQCYVSGDGTLNLHWHQRSWDLFLGAPFNIASYALLLHLLAKWTGLKPGMLSVWAGDVHVYENHMNAVVTYLTRREHPLPILILPDGTESLESTLRLTALDFANSLNYYRHEGTINAPLSVG